MDLDGRKRLKKPEAMNLFEQKAHFVDRFPTDSEGENGESRTVLSKGVYYLAKKANNRWRFFQEAGTTGTSNVRRIGGVSISVPSTPSGGGVTDHGALTGLEDNDHPQYGLLGYMGMFLNG